MHSMCWQQKDGDFSSFACLYRALGATPARGFLSAEAWRQHSLECLEN